QLELAGQLVAAISMLHAGNQVHAAIRPSNVFQSNGLLKLADPRIVQSKEAELTENDIRFTAPEVLSGAIPSATSDLYSAGAVLYRMFSNADPFDDFDLPNLKSKYMYSSPRPLR